MISIKDYFASNRPVAVENTTSLTREDVSVSISDSARNETPAPVTRNEITASSTPASGCFLQCCVLNSQLPTRLDVDKESSARIYGKRKRYFQPEWLQKYDWLVLCKTENRAYCHLCRYVLSANLDKAPKNGVDSFTSKGFNNWKNGSSSLSQHAESIYHTDAIQLLRQQLRGTPIDEQIDSMTKVPH